MNKPEPIGQLVQLDPEKTENPMFAACIMIVTQVHNWGIQGYVQSLGVDGKSGGQAHYRAKHGTFAVIENSCATWLVE